MVDVLTNARRSSSRCTGRGGRVESMDKGKGAEGLYTEGLGSTSQFVQNPV